MHCLLGAALLLAIQGPPRAVPYRWKSVQMVGAGFVDGIVFHPAAKGVRYARTDMGGAYRWDARAERWMPMLDWVPYPDLNLMGVESVAVDPNDAKTVYLACGTYTNATTPDGAILRSHDGGRTFAIARVPIKFGGNENGRGNGERLTVDPHDGKRLLLGTRHDGLWRSDDGAATWRRVESFPAVGSPRGAGVVVTLFDPAAKCAAYVAVSDANGPSLYATRDDGATWSPVPGAPTGLLPTHLVRGEDGALWITYGTDPGPRVMTNGALWRYKDGVWADVTPERPTADRKFGYAAVSVQKDKPEVAIVSTFYHPGGEQIFRTTDGGKTWRPCIGGKETYNSKKAPYVARTGIHWLFDIEIDPFNPDHALFTTGYGGHETFDLTAADRGQPVHWSVMSTGIEESVGLALLSPTKGASLATAIGDYGGGVFRDLDRPLPEGNYANPHFGNTTDVSAGDFAPDTLVRVGVASGGSREGNLGFSLDGGRNWRPAPTTPRDAREGHIAVSSDGKTWVWSLRNGCFRTEDYGQTWTPCAGLTPGLRVVADRTAPSRFYALDLFGGELYVSDDGAKSFVSKVLELPGGLPKRGGDRGDDRGGQDRLYPTPGRTDDLWIAAYDGLYHAAPTQKFARMPGVTELYAFGFGKGAPKAHGPALYMVGVVDGVRGFFRSDDETRSWVRINDDAHQWGLVLQIAGDPRRYGRVYVGTHGRGIFYGDPR